MTDINGQLPERKTRSDERAEANLAAAIAAFETFRDELNDLLCEIREGETARAKKLASAVSEVARAVNRIADEQVKLDAQFARGSGKGTSDGGHSLDLAAARAEVLRRLAELRNVAG